MGNDRGNSRVNYEAKHYEERPLTDDQRKIQALERELDLLRSRHDALGAGYRSACEELDQLRKQIEGYKTRMAAVRVLCDVP